jgi:hypothetical protein
MTQHFDSHLENAHQAQAAGRPVRNHGPYGVLIGDEQLNFTPLVVANGNGNEAKANN